MKSGRGVRILVSGMLAGVPGQGGATWAVLQYVLGLRRLGHDVWFVECLRPESVDPPGLPVERSPNARYFRSVVAAFDLGGTSSLLDPLRRATVGVPYAELRAVAHGADVVIDISGSLTDHDLLGAAPVRVYVDLDPAFNQLWAAVDGIDRRFEGHTHFVTVGLNLGAEGCPIPTCGREWIPTLPPVVLHLWPPAGGPPRYGFTTVANWRAYGSVENQGVRYGQKVHSFREVMALPTRTDESFLLALAIHPGEAADLRALADHGWSVVDPSLVAGTPADYRRFVRASRGELGVAKEGYVRSRSGWFSDRSACYLASGRPVVAQDTGFGRVLPIGEGLLAFGSLEDAVNAVEDVLSDEDRHRKSARAIAEEYLDSDIVLTGLLDRIGANRPPAALRPSGANQ